MTFDKWFYKTGLYIGDEYPAEQAWDHQQEKIEELLEENEKLKKVLMFIALSSAKNPALPEIAMKALNWERAKC